MVPCIRTATQPTEGIYLATDIQKGYPKKIFLDPEGWDGEGGGSGVQDGEHI